eukprot:tig00020944_g16355.t1
MGRVIYIKSQQEFDAHTKNKTDGKLTVIDFTAKWCGPCQMIGPYFDQLSETNTDVVFLKVDVDECAELAQTEGVSCMPTFHFWKGGKKVNEFSGA